MKKTRLKSVSSKRRKTQKKRRSFVAEILASRPDCEAGAIIFEAYRNHTIDRKANLGCLGVGRSTEVHEPLTRARAPGEETILDPDNSVAICSACHRWIHDNVAEATKLDLLVSVGINDERFPKIFKRRE